MTAMTDEVLETFGNETGLAHAVVLDSVGLEVVGYFERDPVAAERVYEYLRSDEALAAIEARIAGAYGGNASFRRALSVKDPRPVFYSFMRHWVSALLRVREPAVFWRLPDGFRAGEPIARGAEAVAVGG